MESLSFDYFVERGTILTEMARPPSTFSDSEVNSAYGQLRRYFSNKYGVKAPDSINVYVFHYIYDVLYDLLPEDVIDEVVGPKLTHNGGDIKLVVTELVKIALNTGAITTTQLAQALKDYDSFDKLVPVIKANAGNRARGRNRSIQDVTGATYDEFLKLTTQTEDLRKKMNAIMRGRAVSRTTLGDKSRYNQIATVGESDNVSPNVQNAMNLSDILGKISKIRSQMRDNGELDDENPPSLWASKSPQFQLKQNIKALSDKEFDETIGGLIDLIEQKIESGVGQTTPGFVKLINNLKSLPNYSKAVISILSHAVDELHTYTPNESTTEESPLAGYDDDVVSKVLDTPEKLDLFKDWLEVYNKWREEKDRILTGKYLDAQEKLKHMINNTEPNNGDISKDVFDAFWNKEGKGRVEPKSNPFNMGRRNHTNSSGDVVQAAKDKLESYGESVMTYMEEQIQRDSKFTHSTNGKFVDRGFKKFKNYNHWLTENE